MGLFAYGIYFLRAHEWIPACGYLDIYVHFSDFIRIVRVHTQSRGPDLFKFLQGLCTNDFDLLDASGENPTKMPGLATAFLNHKGRMLCEAIASINCSHVGENEPEVLLDCNINSIPPLLKHLRMHKLRKKIQMENVTDSHGVIAIVGGPERDAVTSTVSSALEEQSPETPWSVVADPR